MHAAQADLQARNRQMMGKLVVIAVGMLGFGFAMVPMYRQICEAIGISQQRVVAPVNTQVDASRDVTVELLAAAENGNLEGLRAKALDPNGHQALKVAKRLRKRALHHGTLGSPSRLIELAEEHFDVRTLDLGFWSKSGVERPWLLPAEPEPPRRKKLISLAE